MFDEAFLACFFSNCSFRNFSRAWFLQGNWAVKSFLQGSSFTKSIKFVEIQKTSTCKDFYSKVLGFTSKTLVWCNLFRLGDHVGSTNLGWKASSNDSITCFLYHYHQSSLCICINWTILFIWFFVSQKICKLVDFGVCGWHWKSVFNSSTTSTTLWLVLILFRCRRLTYCYLFQETLPIRHVNWEKISKINLGKLGVFINSHD